MSRVLAVIILSLVCISSNFAQNLTPEVVLSKKELKVLRKKIRKMNDSDKIESFVLSLEQKNLLVNLDTVEEIHGLPLPSALAIEKANSSLPEFLPDLLGVDFIINSARNSQVKFLGLDSIGRIMTATPYEDEHALSTALLQHNYLLGVSKEGDRWIKRIQFTKEENKTLDHKMLKLLMQDEYYQNELPETNDLINQFRKWAIQIYALNQDLVELSNEDLTPEQLNNLLPDNNWLSILISHQVVSGIFDNSGSRIQLAEGRPDLFDINLQTLNSIDTIIEEAISKKAIPGCQLLIAKDGYTIFDKSYGYQTYDSLIPVNSKTIYDLASLTKVLATTQALMLLYDQGKFSLDDELSKLLPYLQGSNKQSITGTAVLSHQANLYPYYPFWKKARDEFKLDKMRGPVQAGKNMWVEPWVADSIISWAVNSDLLSERIDTITHSQYFYSDLGFYFLKDLIEQQTSTTLDQYLKVNLFEPAGIDLHFNPLNVHAETDIAPTELDQLLRNELVKGFVHDRNAALFGGVSGQAGLFGNAENVAKVMQIQLDSGTYNNEHFFASNTLKEFRTRHYKNNRRGLGWDMPGDEEDGPVSKYASDETFGHTGFTGGMVWADPKEKLIFVFLSNRIYPSVDNNKLIEENTRTRIQDLVYRSLGYE